MSEEDKREMMRDDDERGEEKGVEKDGRLP
jgi:hypothetical protein